MQLRALLKVKVAIQFAIQSSQVCLSVGDLLAVMHLRAFPNVGQMQCNSWVPRGPSVDGAER